jgi:DNA/RNA-binding domain of Phe-tRNA-synthetase-like protein
MVKEYERRKEEEELMDADTSEESESSIKIYEKAYANFKPECGESNAE